ncbi:FAD-dependent oxidoreductase [Mycobacterium sp. OTB74]|jgi:3-phenylpropionate/trans-cinnamate dioxygenase ferredoxin reductase subunit|uniref:NAD(P)/FAD-dependent oxidoreductase n=1 Tax=Mycobacterium sp. OTB74 TaxID=1853452 RepID=UPI002474CA4E|nr:FAD-dependent oxidoreductase [Mycobacterium sp. OTB74]MDH6246546.1 3-phenylpropionate/trans-cinnamate dioxygenase ferredoxin reductase subunit [Mycobacterium sp. OTB74]
MAASPTFVIVGGGLAGAKAAESLRNTGFAGRVVMFAAEDRLPYERPPLSKEFLAGKKTVEEFTVQPASWYPDHDIDLQLATAVTTLDRSAHIVAYGAGNHEHYDKLLLATGSRSRRPPIPGSDAHGVYFLRTVDDATELLAQLSDGRRLAIVGGGWIGLEVAASARGLGTEVTVVESAALPLLAALGREAAEVFADLHRAHGVDLRLGTTVEEVITAEHAATGLRLGDGSTIAADAVLIAVGAMPNIELAERSGLVIAAGGIAVDESLKSSDDDIYAVGDIASAEHPLFGTPIRTEHWANALKQPEVAAAGMLGTPGSYDELPYFFTDQYDLGMEYVGHAPHYQAAVSRGDLGKREFTMFWLDGEHRVLAGMNVNIWEGLDDIKTLVRSRRPVDASALADRSIALSTLAQ